MAHTKCQVSNCRVFRIWHGLFSIFKVSESWVSTSVKSLPSPTPVNNKAIKQRRWLSYLFCPQASKTIYHFTHLNRRQQQKCKITFTTKSYQFTCCYSVWSANQQFPDWSDWLDPLLTTHLPLFLSSLWNLTDIITYQDSSQKHLWTSITLQRSLPRGRDEEEHIVSSWDDVLWNLNHGNSFQLQH